MGRQLLHWSCFSTHISECNIVPRMEFIKPPNRCFKTITPNFYNISKPFPLINGPEIGMLLDRAQKSTHMLNCLLQGLLFSEMLIYSFFSHRPRFNNFLKCHWFGYFQIEILQLNHDHSVFHLCKNSTFSFTVKHFRLWDIIIHTVLTATLFILNS